MYLLDTDTIIYNLKGNSAVQENLRRHFYDPLRSKCHYFDGAILRSV